MIVAGARASFTVYSTFRTAGPVTKDDQLSRNTHNTPHQVSRKKATLRAQAFKLQHAICVSNICKRHVPISLTKQTDSIPQTLLGSDGFHDQLTDMPSFCGEKCRNFVMERAGTSAYVSSRPVASVASDPIPWETPIGALIRPRCAQTGPAPKSHSRRTTSSREPCSSNIHAEHCCPSPDRLAQWTEDQAHQSDLRVRRVTFYKTGPVCNLNCLRHVRAYRLFRTTKENDAARQIRRFTH